MGAYHRFSLGTALDQEAQAACLAIPGVKLAASGRSIAAPVNCAWLVAEMLTARSIPSNSIAPRVPRERYTAKAALPWLMPWIPEYLTPYQREGVAWILNLPDQCGHMHWSAGCLAGDTELTINRGGAAKRITLRDLVHKFHGGRSETNGHRWDLSIPTYAQSVNAEGFLRLNRIERAYSNGRAAVFEIRTIQGRRIRATADHLFLRADGTYTRLGDLNIGCDVMVATWPQAGASAAKPKATYRLVEGMWNHPHALIRVSNRAGRPGKHKQATVPLHRLVFEAGENGISLAELVGRIVLRQLDGLTFPDPSIHVHHKNENPADNRIENLETLSPEAHHRRHGKQDGWKHVTSRVVPDTIDAIVACGEEEVFDLGMADPLHNYVANGFAVHNSGKTLAAIVWSLATGPAITVVCTKTAVRDSWAAQVDQYARGVEVIRCEGTKPSGLVTASDHPTIAVIGYDVLPDWIGALEALRPRSVVFDEIHTVKNHKRWDARSKGDDSDGVTFALKENRAAAAYRLSRCTKRRLATTATPIKDRVRDLWTQLDLIHPWEWGSFRSFVTRYCAAAENPFGGLDTRGASNLGELKRRLQYVSHRVPYSIANRDLPAKRRQSSWIKVRDQNRVEGGFAAEFRRAARHGATAILEARIMEAASRKRKFILARAQEWLEGGLKVVVFTGRRVDAERMADDARAWMKGGVLAANHRIPAGLSVFCGHGGDSPAARNEMRLAYMAHPGPCLLVATGESFGEGLDLQDTDVAIMAMLPYTPGQIIQYEGRFARLGQKRPVLIWYPVAEGTVDEHVAAILLKKLPAVEKATKSDEISGLGAELIGATDEELINSLAAKIIGSENAE